MNRKVKKILGINPGTRYLGLAVFNDSELLDWRIKAFTGKWTNEKMRRILKIIIEQIELYDINAMRMKKLHPSRSSKYLKNLVHRIRALARRKRIKYTSYSIKEIESVFLNNEKPNKRNLADKVAIEYPMLIYDLNKEKIQRNSYYMRAIEAVALGISRS
jgi:hypothetical protein